jgi:hypothetical protein
VRWAMVAGCSRPVVQIEWLQAVLQPAKVGSRCRSEAAAGCLCMRGIIAAATCMGVGACSNAEHSMEAGYDRAALGTGAAPATGAGRVG